MKYITVEQFLQADTKVQNAILDWWKPSVGDMIASTKDDNKYCVIDNFIEAINCCSLNLYNTINCTATKNEVVPLLTEGQLREFIEENADKIRLIEDDIETLNVVLFNGQLFKSKEKDLLQALWQVVCEIVLNTN